MSTLDNLRKAFTLWNNTSCACDCGARQPIDSKNADFELCEALHIYLKTMPDPNGLTPRTITAQELYKSFVEGAWADGSPSPAVKLFPMNTPDEDPTP